MWRDRPLVVENHCTVEVNEYCFRISGKVPIHLDFPSGQKFLISDNCFNEFKESEDFFQTLFSLSHQNTWRSCSCWVLWLGFLSAGVLHASRVLINKPGSDILHLTVWSSPPLHTLIFKDIGQNPVCFVIFQNSILKRFWQKMENKSGIQPLDSIYLYFQDQVEPFKSQTNITSFLRL